MLIAILHPEISPEATLEDQDTLVQVRTVGDCLVRLGHEVVEAPCTLDLATLRERLAAIRPALVFNLAESMAETDSLQHLPTALLDAMGLPYTGCSTEAMFQANHKLLAKRLLCLVGLPTPAWLARTAFPPKGGTTNGLPTPAWLARTAFPPKGGTTNGLPTPAWMAPKAAGRSTSDGLAGSAELRPPCILKAVWEHASRGLDEQNVVTEGDVGRRLDEFAARCGRPCFAEAFVDGREFNVSILDGPRGPEVLPPAEIDFSAFPPGKHRIVGHQAKWDEGSFEFRHTPRTFDFPPGSQALLDELGDLALRCWRLFELSGYARIDFRVDQEGRPWILEVNTNPCLSPDAGFAAAVQRAGLDMDRAVERMVGEGARS